MKTNQRKLHLINLLVVSIDNFYAITIYESSITLQGRFNPMLIQKLSHLFKFTFDVNGYVCAKSHGIDITFTN